MIKFNNSIIENAIMDALDKMEREIEINEFDRNELINVILKYGDRDFGIKNKDTGKDYTEEELQNSIYIHIVNENNKCYVGQTSVNPKDRWGSNGIWYRGQVFYNAIKYYGWDNISHIVLCHWLSQEQANEMEVALISIFKSTNRDEFGYNVANGGDSKGKHSEETRKKISEANKGENNHWYGKHLSEETRKKISESNKGKHTGENNPMFGKHPSEETRKKLSEARKGEKHPMFGKHHSEETRNKMSEAKKGKFVGCNSHSAKKVLCNEMIFPTAKECSEYYNVNYGTMRNWLQGRRKTPSDFIEKGLRYATQEDIKTYASYIEESENKIIECRNGENDRKGKKVLCNGQIFTTAKECAKFYNVNYSTMRSWLQGKRKTPSEFIEKGLKFATTEDINTYPLYIEEEQNQQKQQD